MSGSNDRAEARPGDDLPAADATAAALLAEVLAAHGGVARWRAVERIEMRGTVVGELWPRRGLEGLLANASITLEARRQASSYRDYGTAGETGHFRPDHVGITASDGRIVEERADPGAHFAAQDMRAPWDRLDALYANGYGTWTEVMLPYLLTWPGTRVRALPPADDRHGRWRRLAADFPDTLLTHRETVLWIGADGRVARVEFTPAVGGVMRSAVFWSDYRTFDGIPMPTRRRMVPILDDTPQDGPTMLDEHDLAFAFRFAPDRGAGEGTDKATDGRTA